MRIGTIQIPYLRICSAACWAASSCFLVLRGALTWLVGIEGCFLTDPTKINIELYNCAVNMHLCIGIKCNIKDSIPFPEQSNYLNCKHCKGIATLYHIQRYETILNFLFHHFIFHKVNGTRQQVVIGKANLCYNVHVTLRLPISFNTLGMVLLPLVWY